MDIPTVPKLPSRTQRVPECPCFRDRGLLPQRKGDAIALAQEAVDFIRSRLNKYNFCEAAAPFVVGHILAGVAQMIALGENGTKANPRSLEQAKTHLLAISMHLDDIQEHGRDLLEARGAVLLDAFTKKR